MRDDWYRSSGWSRADRELFEQKLQRARPWNRAQYIRLKGLALAASNRRRERRSAPELFRRVIHDHANDELQTAMAWADLGRFYAEEGEDELSAEALRACLDAEASYGGGLHTGSELALAEVIVRAEWTDRYAEAGAATATPRRAVAGGFADLAFEMGASVAQATRTSDRSSPLARILTRSPAHAGCIPARKPRHRSRAAREREPAKLARPAS